MLVASELKSLYSFWENIVIDYEFELFSIQMKCFVSRPRDWHISKHKVGFHFRCDITIFTNPSTQAGYDTRSIFKRGLTGLNSEAGYLVS